MEIDDKQVDSIEKEIWDSMDEKKSIGEHRVFIVHRFNRLREKVIPRIIRKHLRRQLKELNKNFEIKE